MFLKLCYGLYKQHGYVSIEADWELVGLLVTYHGYSGRSLIIDDFISTSQDDKIVTLGQVSGVIAYFPRYQCKTPTMKTRTITTTKSTMNTWTRRKENLRMLNDFVGIEV